MNELDMFLEWWYHFGADAGQEGEKEEEDDKGLSLTKRELFEGKLKVYVDGILANVNKEKEKEKKAMEKKVAKKQVKGAKFKSYVLDSVNEIEEKRLKLLVSYREAHEGRKNNILKEREERFNRGKVAWLELIKGGK